MNYLCRRVSTLEHSAWLAIPPSVMERFTAALDDTARRLTGTGLNALDITGWARVADEPMGPFMEALNDSDLERLIAELALITGVQA